jgi:hypothetical protein
LLAVYLETAAATRWGGFFLSSVRPATKAGPVVVTSLVFDNKAGTAKWS